MSNIVSDQQVSMAMIIYTNILGPALQLVAIFANILNIQIFYTMGIKDSVNITFFALSLSDMAYLVLDASSTITLIIGMSPWQQELPVGMYSLNGCIHWYQYIFLDTSTCLETYLAITRACCVAMPLRFKHIFTTKKTMSIIACIFLCNFFLRIPLFSSYGLAWHTSSMTNQTKLTFYSRNHFYIFNLVEQLVARTVCPVIFLCISVVCSIILTRALAQASAMRKLLMRSESFRNDHGQTGLKRYGYIKTISTLSTKEVQLVKAVTLVISLLGILLLVLSLFSLGQAAEPELFPGKKFSNLHGVFTVAVNLLIISHSGYKFVIYYTFNSRFRSVLKNVLLLTKEN